VTPLITTADAIGNDVFGMYQSLRDRGHDARLFANEWTTNGVGVAKPEEIPGFLAGTDDVLIYHYSMGWDLGLDLLRETKCKRVVKYHNITTPAFFTGFSSLYENICRVGRQQLKDIAKAGCDLYLSDSEFNRQELLLEGADENKNIVVPPFHHIDMLQTIEADMSIIDAYRDGKTNILMVGRVAPNKDHAGLIRAFALYRSKYNQNSRLLIVGKEPWNLESYAESLRDLVARWGLRGAVVFAGCVSNEQLKAFYLVSHAFLLTSLHEGFCVPLVEAMAMKVPIVAYASPAVSATIGNAGLVWQERNPFFLAESLDVIAKDESTSVALGLMGWRRYEQHFTRERIDLQFRQALGDLL
jgi:glycosyltransferase involved in cell wall biosynthesis